MAGQEGRQSGTVDSGQRRCAGCSAPLAADNTARLCSRCYRDQRDQLRTPPVLRDEFWTTDDFRAAFETRHIGRVFKAYRNHSRHLKLFGKALNQELFGRWLGLTQAQVSKLENGRPEQNLETLQSYAEILHMPQHLLWFDLPGQSRVAARADSNSPQLSVLQEAALITPQVSWPNTAETMTGYLLSDSLSFERREPGPTKALASTIRETTADLMVMDFKRGGGHTRRMLMHYFQDEVAPLLSWRYPDTDLRSEIFSAAAETLQLLGWSAYDAGDHHSARRHFGQALRLAQEVGDVVMAGRILSNVSHQANFLGRFDEALRLAREAQDLTRGRASNTVASMFLAMEARASASLGDERATVEALHRAEQLHEARDLERDPAWSGYFNSQELASEAAHCFRDLGQADKCREYAELSMDPLHTPPRTLGFMRMVAASGSLAGGDAEHAVTLASEAIRLGISLQSARYVKYVTDFYSTLTAKDRLIGREVSDLLRAHYPALILPV
jgi:tetratricopeptide (TPR) repeat protein